MTLAGLTCGDRGPSIGAATALVAVNLDTDMDGEWRTSPCVNLRKAVLTIYGHLGEGLFAYSMRAEGEGKVRGTDYEGRSLLEAACVPMGLSDGARGDSRRGQRPGRRL